MITSNASMSGESMEVRIKQHTVVANRLEAIAINWLEAIALRLEAIASRLETIASVVSL